MQEEGSAMVYSEVIVDRIKLTSMWLLTMRYNYKINVIVFSYELCTEFGFTQCTVMKINIRTGYDERN
jgi:hypothetical protein